MLEYVKLYEKEIEIEENENSFKKLIEICKKGGKCFSNDLLNSESIEEPMTWGGCVGFSFDAFNNAFFPQGGV